jgi:hypothetical protein
VHEITHILRGITWHSDEGLTKAHWDKEDLVYMAIKPLSFAERDVGLIHRGLAARGVHAIVAGRQHLIRVCEGAGLGAVIKSGFDGRRV